MAKKKAAKKKSAKSSGGAGKGSGKGKRAAPPTKHKKRRIGHVGYNHASLPYKADWGVIGGDTINKVYVFGDRLGRVTVNPKKAVLDSKRYEWDNANVEVVNNGQDGVIIKCKCKPKHSYKPKGPGYTTDDDITITLTFDDGGGLPPDETEDTYDEVPFEP